MSQTAKDRFKVFIQDARLLTESETAALPEEKRAAVSGKAGVWIEVLCPQGACSLEGGKITLPVGGSEPEGSKGIWLNLFCPDNQCMINEDTDLP